MRDNTANAEWNGSLKEGKGSFSTGSGAIAGASYTFATRFADAAGTNPEEMIAAAHSSCFSMALSAQLGERGLTPNSVKTTATVSLGKTDAGPGITRSHLDVVGNVPGATVEQFIEAAEAAKKGCPISRLLNTEITMSARLEG